MDTMLHFIKHLLYIFSLLRFMPHAVCYYLHQDHALLQQERNRWIKVIKHEEAYTFGNFMWLLAKLPQYRTVFYLRVGKMAVLLRLFARGIPLAYVNTLSVKIGAGFVLQHGYATIVEAVSIGVNCQVWHNVTVGTNTPGSGNKPTIGNNVKIYAGAIVIGPVFIGNNTTIGAGAVVTKSIPDDCVVVGNPAYIIKKDHKKVRILL